MKRIYAFVPPAISVMPCFFVLAPTLTSAEKEQFVIEKDQDAVVIRESSGQEVLRYQLQRPANSKLSVDSACYFHPFMTPGGTMLTEVAPSDHLHHRGIFLAWVEMHGKKDADFWGWGEHAPKKDRQITNSDLTGTSANQREARFRAGNLWQAEGETVISEDLRAALRRADNAYILDLDYRLTPAAEMTLSQWAFSGFCVRMRKDGKLQAEGPEGRVKFPNPKHTEPGSAWPAASWYAFTLQLQNGKTAGAALLNHPENPPSLWHNHRDLGMLNPCIVAPGAVTLRPKAPLRLRYRVVAFDGPLPRVLLDRLASKWKS